MESQCRKVYWALIPILSLLISLVNENCALKILILHPLQGGSHRIQLRVLGRALEKRGHNVTTVSFVNVGDNVEDLSWRHEESNETTHHLLTLDNRAGHYPYMTREREGRFHFPNELLWAQGDNPHNLPWDAFLLTEALCRALFLDNDELGRHLVEVAFDVAIVDLISNECGLALAHSLGIQSVVAYWAMFPIGGEMEFIPSFLPTSVEPSFLSRLSADMSFAERLYNAYLRLGSWFVMQIQFHLVSKYLGLYAMPRTKESSLQSSAGASVPSLQLPMPHPQHLIANLSGVLINSDYSLDYGKLLPPNAVNVGCMQCKPAEPLSQELESFMQSAEPHGVIVFSMGALFDAAVAHNLIPKLFAAFSRLPQKVIMKANLIMPPDFVVPPNVKIVKWLPQQDLLGHAGTRAFLSHCGLHGVMEAMWHGVPIIGMPIYGDQFDVLVRIQEKGIGLPLFKHATDHQIYDTLNAILSNSSMKSNCKKWQNILRDQKEHPLDRAIWFIEFLSRHDGGHHLKLPSRFVPWYTYFCVDIILFASVILFCIMLITLKSFQRFCKIRRSISIKSLNATLNPQRNKVD